MTKQYAKGSVERWLSENDAELQWISETRVGWVAVVVGYWYSGTYSAEGYGRTILEAVNKAIKKLGENYE